MICEGCIKQDTCKYRERVEKYEHSEDFERDTLAHLPLVVTISCEYKQTCVPYPPNCTDTDCDTTTYPDGNAPYTYTA